MESLQICGNWKDEIMKEKIIAKKHWIPLVLSIIALVLELLPYGAVLHFAEPEGSIRRTYSYFSLIPYGYANIGPLITAFLTCMLLALDIVYALSKADKFAKYIRIVSIIAVVASLMPLMFGLRYFTFVAVLITVLHMLIFLSVSKKKNLNKEK